MTTWLRRLLAAAVVALALAAPASGGNQWGFNFLKGSCCTMYGGRASISGPGWNFGVPNEEAGLVGVTASGHGTNHFNVSIEGYMQAGIILTQFQDILGLDGDPSCNASQNRQFTEIGWKGLQPSWTYQCKFWNTIGTDQTAHRYAVLRRSTSEGDDWSDYIDSVQLQNNDDIMPTANGIATPCCGLSSGDAALTAGGEFTDDEIGCVKGTYGTGVPANWQRATAPGGNSWFDIQDSFKFDSTGDWNLGSPPGTFVVSSDKKHSCPGGNPTAVSVSSFAVRGRTISWRTGDETGVLGFEVWRGARKVTRTLVHAKGGVRGASYRVVDRTLPAGRRPLYRLRRVGLDGLTAWIASARASR